MAVGITGSGFSGFTCCTRLTGEALATLVVNKLRGIVNVCAIKAPGFGERRKALLQDIAIVTGAEYIAKDLGMKVESASLEQLGVARKARGTGLGFQGLGHWFLLGLGMLICLWCWGSACRTRSDVSLL